MASDGYYVYPPIKKALDEVLDKLDVVQKECKELYIENNTNIIQINNYIKQIKKKNKHIGILQGQLKRKTAQYQKYKKAYDNFRKSTVDYIDQIEEDDADKDEVIEEDDDEDEVIEEDDDNEAKRQRSS